MCPAPALWAMWKFPASPAPSPSTTVPTTLRSKSPQVIWSGPVSPPAGRTGINTHRLLAIQIEPLIVAPIVAIPMLLMLVIILLLPRQPRKKRGGDADEDE